MPRHLGGPSAARRSGVSGGSAVTGPANGGAVGFTAASLMYANAASAANLTIPGDGAISTWLYATSLPATYQKLITKLGGSAGADEWFLQINPTGGPGATPTLEWGYSNGSVYSVIDAGITLATATWYHAYVDFSATIHTLGMSINNAAPGSISGTGTIHVGTNPVRFGADNVPAGFFNGRIGPTGIWQRILTTGERAELWNDSNGLRKASLPAGLLTGLGPYWDFQDGTDTWLDSNDSDPLTSVNGVFLAAGKTWG